MGISGNKSSRAAYAPSVFIKQTQLQKTLHGKSMMEYTKANLRQPF